MPKLRRGSGVGRRRLPSRAAHTRPAVRRDGQAPRQQADPGMGRHRYARNPASSCAGGGGAARARRSCCARQALSASADRWRDNAWSPADSAPDRGDGERRPRGRRSVSCIRHWWRACGGRNGTIRRRACGNRTDRAANIRRSTAIAPAPRSPAARQQRHPGLRGQQQPKEIRNVPASAQRPIPLNVSVRTGIAQAKPQSRPCQFQPMWIGTGRCVRLTPDRHGRFSRTSSSGADHGYGSIFMSAASSTRGPTPLAQM